MLAVTMMLCFSIVNFVAANTSFASDTQTPYYKSVKESWMDRGRSIYWRQRNALNFYEKGKTLNTKDLRKAVVKKFGVDAPDYSALLKILSEERKRRTEKK